MQAGAIKVQSYAQGAVMAPHAHDEPSLSLVVSGAFAEEIDGEERAYFRGHVTYCPAGRTHAQHFGEGGARQIILQPRPEWLDYLADCKVVLDAAPHVNRLIFGQIGDRLVRELAWPDAHSALACDGMVLELVAGFGRSCSAPIDGGEPPAWLRAARDFMHAHALRPLTLSEIASASGRHEIHLAREFRRHFGSSVGAYLRRLRIERAQALIAQGDLSLSEIALDCGFSSHAHLCREFKAQLGMTPSEFRAARAG